MMSLCRSLIRRFLPFDSQGFSTNRRMWLSAAAILAACGGAASGQAPGDATAVQDRVLAQEMASTDRLGHGKSVLAQVLPSQE